MLKQYPYLGVKNYEFTNKKSVRTLGFIYFECVSQLAQLSQLSQLSQNPKYTG